VRLHSRDGAEIKVPDLLRMLGASTAIPDFVIYSPENSALRAVHADSQLLPLGGRGEGLLAHLKALAGQPGSPTIAEINQKLELLDWFERLEVPPPTLGEDRTLLIRDRYLGEGALFDQRSANEGFLFLLFYFTLFASPDTPRFFAVDNVDASLNPKLCQALTTELVALAKQHDKQVILTTHNPAVLDGLDLKDDEQRLFVVSRGADDTTSIHRIEPPRPLAGDRPVRMSEAFLRGYIGGLPKNF
jgi:predicted ATPase